MQDVQENPGKVESVALDAIAALIMEARQARDERLKWEAKEEGAKRTIKDMLRAVGKNVGTIDGKPVVSSKPYKAVIFDQAAFKRDQPRIYAEYCKTDMRAKLTFL